MRRPMCHFLRLAFGSYLHQVSKASASAELGPVATEGAQQVRPKPCGVGAVSSYVTRREPIKGEVVSPVLDCFPTTAGRAEDKAIGWEVKEARYLSLLVLVPKLFGYETLGGA